MTVTELEQTENAKKGKIEYITLLNVLSAIAVVFLHTNNCFWTFSTESYWFSANIVECLFYFAVPVFFMITGATLMEYKERYSTKQFMIRRIRKTVIPFLVWSAIGLLAKLCAGKIAPSDMNIKYMINSMLGTSVIGIYWFFPALFCMYLCIPLFASVNKDHRKQVFSYLTVICFIVNCLVPFADSVFQLGLEWPFSVSVASGNLLYLLIGYLLNIYDLKARERVGVYILAIIGLLMHIIGTYRLSIESGAIVQTFKGYDNVPCILYSVGIWVFVKKHGTSIMRSKIGGVIRWIEKYTFGIYLTHYYGIRVVRWVFENVFSVSYVSLLYRLGSPAIIIAISISVIYVMRKLPVIKNIVP